MRAVLLLSLFIYVSCESPFNSEQPIKVEKAKQEVFYTCSMHPQIHEKKPGKCPICAMGLSKVVVEHDDFGSDQKTTAPQKMVYYCASDPSVTSEAPGECPLDGSAMLMKRPSKNTVAKVRLRKAQVEHFRADLFSVEHMKMQKKIRLLGTVMKSEERESNIPARVPGRVEEVLVQSTGSLIRKGDPVLKLYSPQLLTGGDEFLIARKNFMANKGNPEFIDLYKQSKQRMKLWGVQESQLESWGKDGKIPREITIYSPVTGIVERKNAIVGKYFKEGQSFFDLVDLSSLWVEMDVYEHDSALVDLGQRVEIEFNASPGELWEGEIDFINPVLDERSRTLKVRTTLENKNGKLRPGMAGVASVTLELKERPLVIPRSAVIDTGKRKIAWLAVGKSKHRYEAREIHTGFESEGYVEVKHGLSEGEQVVIEGNFLLDAQAQLFGGYSKENDESSTQSGHHH